MRKHLTIIELLEQSELIFRGRVTKLSDGADARGVPYTEVTFQFAESLKGAPGRAITSPTATPTDPVRTTRNSRSDSPGRHQRAGRPSSRRATRSPCSP